MLASSRPLLLGLLLLASTPVWGQNAAYVGDLRSVDPAFLNAAVAGPAVSARRQANAAPAPSEPRRRVSVFERLVPSWLLSDSAAPEAEASAPVAGAGAAGAVRPVAYARRSSLSHRSEAQPRTRWTQPATATERSASATPRRSGGVATRSTAGRRPSLIDLAGFSRPASAPAEQPHPASRPAVSPAAGVAAAGGERPAQPFALAPPLADRVRSTTVGDTPRTTPQIIANPALAALAKAPAPTFEADAAPGPLPEPTALAASAPLVIVNDTSDPRETGSTELPTAEGAAPIVFVSDESLPSLDDSPADSAAAEFTETAPLASGEATPSTPPMTPTFEATDRPASDQPAVVAMASDPIIVSDLPATPESAAPSVSADVADASLAETATLDQPELEPLPMTALASSTPESETDEAETYREQRIGLPPRRPSRELEPSDRAKSLLAEAHGLARQASGADDYTAILQRCRYVLAIERAPQAVSYANQLAAWSLNCRGEALLERGRVEEAEADFTDALRTDRECWRAEHNLGVLDSHRGEPERARRRFDRTLQLNPEYAKAYSHRAAVSVQQGDFQAALRDYQRAIEADPDLAVAHTGRGRVCHLLGKLELALRHLDAAVLLEPSDASIAVARGDLLVDLGRYGQAKAAYERAIALDPENGDAYRNLAWMQATCPVAAFRDGQAAVTNAGRAAELTGGDDITLDTHAAALAAVGRFEEAARLQQRAVDAAPPSDAEAYLGRLEGYLRGEAFTSRPLGGGVVQATYNE